MIGKHDSVLGALHVTLQIVGTHFAGPTPRSLGLLGSPEGGATVCNDCIQGHIVTNLGQFTVQYLNLNTLGIKFLIGELLFILT